MALWNPTFILGLLVLLYLSSFLLFAVLRTITGISIQRIGYLSLRRIAYTPRDGIKLEIRGLGFVLHRPTFAQPTWISLVLQELHVTVDLKALGGERDGSGGPPEAGTVKDADGPNCVLHPPPPARKRRPRRVNSDSGRSRTWQRMTDVKERIKRLHRKIRWIRQVDVVATNTVLTLVDVGCLQVGSFTTAVDTRRKTVDRSRLFHHHRFSTATAEHPAEWIITVRSVLFTPESREPLEILDQCSLNVHGLLYRDLDGLRDAAIALKLGRIHVPYDDFMTCLKRYHHCRSVYGRSPDASWDDDDADLSLTDVMAEVDREPTHRQEVMMRTVADSKEFVGSILRGIKEVQFAVGFVGLTKQIPAPQPSGAALYLNLAMKEVGIDLHRLDSRAPAHRMYFASSDTAHQALAAAIGLSVDVDDGHGAPEKLLYIPMLTTTIKTTLPSKTLQRSEDENAAERNANILFANMVITSPSIDLDPKHLPLVLTLVETSVPPPQSDAPSLAATTSRNHHLISRLLPKANIKLSVHEPVIRVALPTPEADRRHDDDYDLLISSISSISLDVESSHASIGELHYSVASTFRVMAHQLYYQTATGVRHNLLTTDLLELRLQVSATPEVYVVATGNLQTFSLHMVRPEISDGVRQIVKQVRRGLRRRQTESSSLVGSPRPSFLRRLPQWLVSFQLQGSNVGLEVAGVDPDISENNRGVAMQLESWSAEYKAQRNDPLPTHQTKRRTASRSSESDHAFIGVRPPPVATRAQRESSDGRRLTLHVRKLECFVVEAVDTWEPEPFVSLPRLDLGFSSSSDVQGAVLHISSSLKTLFVQYSLYRHYAIGVAVMVLRGAFVRTRRDLAREKEREAARASQLARPPMTPMLGDPDPSQVPVPPKEFVTVDVKAALLQIKATMPADPAMMIQVFSLDTGRHRWAAPFVKAKVMRLYATSPKHRHIWSRIVSVKNARVDYRESRRKAAGVYHDERSVDIATEAIRLGIPYQLIPHKIFDNITNVVKATEQLHHRFKTSTDEYILNKPPQRPKRVPRVSLRSKALLLEFEDSPFEWKLSTIYRVGLVEQKHRLAREEAFRVKIKKMEDTRQRRGSSNNLRSRSLYPRGTSQNDANADGSKPGRSHGRKHRRRSSDHSGERGRKMRYDPEGVCGMSEEARVSIREARRRLDEHNAQSWKKRIDWGMSFQRRGMKDIRGVFWAADEQPDGVENTETIMEIPQRPGLMTTLISDLHVVIDKPSFPREKYPKFLHRIGKGMPMDMQYSLLIPMSLQIDMGEARISLRDYPLPMLHVPAIRSNQSPRLPSWSLKTDFVIAEEYRDVESSRQVRVQIVPPDRRDSSMRRAGFTIDVRRTVSPVKTYSDVNVDINTGHATRITWGTAFQPAIQDMMMIVETFTKPQVDPSDRVGFWDKIRLGFHSRLTVAWKGDGDVHLLLKGSRNPYVVTGYGAGFVMCWRNDVRWQIARDDDPRKFMTVDSGEYVLAVPDLSHQAQRQSMDASAGDGDSIASTSSYKNGAFFKKVIMKLNGNVRWLSGLVFERNLADGGGRSFHFKPHYTVTMKNPKFARAAAEGRAYDAYEGFRSHHIHLSIAVAAPLNRDWSVTNLKPSSNYNTVHLSPRYFTHFFSWWSNFSGVMSLPIRQGRLWPGVEKSSKKFGRHLATIKYNLLLSPLFISHVYKHKDVEEYSEDIVAATGLKVRLDSFMLDLHQRREEFACQVTGRKNQAKTTGMRINQAQLDFINADIRAISASIAGTTAEDLKRANDNDDISFSQLPTSVDLSRFTIPDRDFSWVDMDDFVELDWILPAESNPETKILPLAFAPRFTYFRQTDHHDSISGDPTRSSAFGNEPTHYCVMSQDNDPRKVQRDLIAERLASLRGQMDEHWRSLGEAELKVVRDDYKDRALREQWDMLKHHGEMLKRKEEFLNSMLRRMSHRLDGGGRRRADVDTGDREPDESNGSSEFNSDPELEGMDSAPLADYTSDFNNRFIVHNMQLKWNNSLRDIILRYIHQVSQRRGFVYYMSRRAVTFILDIIDEQNRATCREPAARDFAARKGSEPGPTNDAASEAGVTEQIRQVLKEAKKFAATSNTPRSSSECRREATATATATATASARDEPMGHVAHEFTPQNSYHVRLIAPQIQLQSEKNVKSAVLVTAKGMQLKVIQIMDKDRVADDVSGLVQRRFSLDMDSVQFFVSNQKSFATHFLHMYSGTRYGSNAGSSWPPWVPMEVMFDFQINPFGFSRVVQKTSASLRYDKYNTLRLKYNDELTSDDAGDAADSAAAPMEARIDQLWVDFPQVRAICDSLQYYAMYIIVLDLLLYSEPLEKVRSERLEKIMLAADFSDLRGAPEMVTRLQERILQLEEIKTHFQINAKHLDRQGWEDRLSIERDIASCEDELFFMMKAITTSQRKYDDRSETNGLLKWSLSASEVVWHLIREKNEPLVEFQLQDAEYERTDNSDGSNDNLMQIGRIYGLNLLPHALYPTMIAPFFDNTKSFADGDGTKMLRVSWYMLEAIAGIPVVNNFEVNLFPLKVQLEREIGKKLFEYIFPGAGSAAFEEAGFSPFNVKTLAPNGSHTDEPAPADHDAASTTTDGHSVGGTTPVEDPDAVTGTEALELRLKPTMSLSHKNHRHRATPSGRFSKHGHSLSANLDGGSSHHFRLFTSSANKSPKIGSSGGAIGDARSPTIRTPTTKRSSESLKTTGTGPRKSSERSYTNLASLSMTAVNPSSDRVNASDGTSKKRFILQRTNTGTTDEKPSDDLTQMISRASNFMTLAYVKIPSVVLCLSYKGRGDRNIEDVHDFVFRMPVVEYRNKTWSNLDLALHLKKDVIKALISHTGAIIGNKLGHHRPSRREQSRLREVAGYSSLLAGTSSTPDFGGGGGVGMDGHSDSSSMRASSPGNPSPTRRSLNLSHDASTSLSRTASVSSVRSSSLAPPTAWSSSTVNQETGQSTRNGSLHGHGAGSGSSSTGLMHNALTRGLSSLGQKAAGRMKDGGSEEVDEKESLKEGGKGGVGKLLVKKLRGTS